MTITNDDREPYQTAVSDFHTQHEPDSCFPTALKNIFDELADRKDESNLRYSISDLGDALDYVENRASASELWCAVNETHRVVDIVFRTELGKELHSEHVGSRRFKLRVE